MMAEDVYLKWPKAVHSPKLAFMDVASATNARSFIGTYLHGFAGNHKVPVLTVANGSMQQTLRAAAVLNSLVFDFCLRNRLGGLSLGWFILEESPFPSSISQEHATFLLLRAARLNLLHRRFAPEWLKLKALLPDLKSREWKHWWAVTEPDRLRLRLEIDACCAGLFGLDSDDLDWIARDDPTDPKGFHRIDKQLPVCERYPALATATFRALEERKWSTEAATSLSNNEFFTLIGIPELTGSDPLIKRRGGCHRWRPEEFVKDDARSGWTWDHCWQDAVALLGNEAAVKRYIEQKGDDFPTKEETSSSKEGQTDLFGDPLPVKRKQGKLF